MFDYYYCGLCKIIAIICLYLQRNLVRAAGKVHLEQEHAHLVHLIEQLAKMHRQILAVDAGEQLDFGRFAGQPNVGNVMRWLDIKVDVAAAVISGHGHHRRSKLGGPIQGNKLVWVAINDAVIFNYYNITIRGEKLHTTSHSQRFRR